jgi:WD40 repeat protein
MTLTGRSTVVLTIAWVLTNSPWANPVRAQDPNVAVSSAAVDSPGRGALAGFVATPQVYDSGNRAFLIAPNGLWFLATSPRASEARLIDLGTGTLLRVLSKPGFSITGLAISPDSKTVFAQNDNHQITAWDAATGQLVTAARPSVLRNITQLSLAYHRDNEDAKATSELLSRYHIESHFPDLEKFDAITINPTQEYAIIGYVGDPRWNAFQIWNLKEERTEAYFRLGDISDKSCGGYHPFAFDYDGKHLVFGNTLGESASNHLDFTVFEITQSGSKLASADRTLVDHCSFPPGFDFGVDQGFTISPDAHFITKGGGMPGSPEWTAWDLRDGQKIASIHPDGLGIVSQDGSTFAVLHDLQRDGSRSKQMMTVRRGGRQKTFEIPRSMQSDDRRSAVLSSNGRWIASQVGDTVAVWSSRDGKARREYHFGKDWVSDILRVSDSGDPLLVIDKDGTAFVNGRWRAVRSEPNGLIVPLTPNFRAQCGVMFCDRVIAELGVVERKPIDDRAGQAARSDLSPDGRFMTVSLRDTESTDVVDVADGHVVRHIDGEKLKFTPDGRFIVVPDVASGSFVKYELATGNRVWTAIPNWHQDGFYMIQADGRVRYSSTGDADFALVRGFEIHPFDAAAAKQFVAPPDR